MNTDVNHTARQNHLSPSRQERKGSVKECFGLYLRSSACIRGSLLDLSLRALRLGEILVDAHDF